MLSCYLSTLEVTNVLSSQYYQPTEVYYNRNVVGWSHYLTWVSTKCRSFIHLSLCDFFVCFLSFTCRCRSREKSTLTSFSKRKLRLLIYHEKGILKVFTTLKQNKLAVNDKAHVDFCLLYQCQNPKSLWYQRLNSSCVLSLFSF